MFGTLIKYSLVAAAGAVAFAVALHYTDDQAVQVIRDTIDTQLEIYRAQATSEEELRGLMAAYIRTNRAMWDGTYQMKEAAAEVQAIYDVWL